ncbi:uncharacterized protein LOC110708819 [Chenopodium quinoa]|uniref:uncharacterized protein LOC110708819 n=1 Tax=Chenopodium quinoa TaxID=63459 RepID=UPI000B797462|nr:uncharacterized protein LOC110708819 [Chenopodium quinoa]
MSRLSHGYVLGSPLRCHCGLLVSKSRGWTKKNPGRRFIACLDYDAETERRGCKFFRWLDREEPTNWQTRVILGLMEDKEKLKNELISMRRELTEANHVCRKAKAEYTMLKMKRAAKMKVGFSCQMWVVVLVLLPLFVIYYVRQ